MINKESIEKVIKRSLGTLEDKINNLSQTNLNVQDIIYKQSPGILERGLKFNSEYQKKFIESDLKRVPLSSIIQSQYGDNYKNASSEYTAEQFQKVINEELTHENVREQDFYPLLVDKKTNIIIDGNHRHYALSKINSPYVVVLYGESGEPENLTGEDIFDITTTGMPYYDTMINSTIKNVVKYFKKNKKLTFEIEWMSPEDYLKEAYYIPYPKRIDKTPPRLHPLTRMMIWDTRKSLVEKYKERVLEGSKMPMPMLDYDKFAQEGRHRAVVAMELGVEEIPVLVVRTYNEH